MQKRGASSITLVIIRSFDLLFSLAALLVFSPLMLLVVITLRFSGEGEVLYRQIRIGKKGCEFYLLKFATMMKNSPAMGSGELTLPNDSRVLPFGRILRKTKLNELPQLLNILAGDLSLIGPRPQTRWFYNCYHPSDCDWINTIRPGLSGVGSIIFRDEETLLTKVADPVTFDNQVIMPYKGQVERWFAMNQSVSLYFELILITVLVVLAPSSRLRLVLLSRVPQPPAALSKLLES
jgi:lipopolysaccharide/colanic/teichoic acid biosynthesis glycosyltransferase